MEKICETSRSLLADLNEKPELTIFFHEEEGSFLEVKTGIKSPYLIFEIDVDAKFNKEYSGVISDIWLVQEDGECFEIFFDTLPKWHRGLKVEVGLFPVLAEGGVLKELR